MPAIARTLSCLIVVAAITVGVLSGSASLGTPSSTEPPFSPVTSRFSLSQPSIRIQSLGEIEFASIYLDGVSLFQIASPKVYPSESEAEGNLSPLERRVRRIESRIYNIINIGFEPQTLEVRPATLNNLTVIVAADRKYLSQQVILTVTEIDAQIAPASVTDLAGQWSEVIREALIQAWQARQPEARKRQTATVAKIILGMIIMSFLLVWGQKGLKNRFKLLQKRVKEQSSTPLKSEALPSPPQAEPFFSEPLGVLRTFRQQANLEQQLILNILLQRLAQIGLVLLWFGGLAAILSVFPETRSEGRGLIVIPLRIFIIWFVLTLISNLANLYVNHNLREWVEQGLVISEDTQRRILRAPTLLAISRGIIRFVCWCIGILWFLLWKGVFPSSLLTGAGFLGAALTFVFQSLLKDWINGILIIFEDQYAVGDLIDFNGMLGVVENMSLRATQIRTLDGRLSTIPHNQITIAHNLSKDWSRVVFTIEVAYHTDPTVAIALMKQVAREMADDPQWQEDIIDPVSLIGVNCVAHSGIQIMMWIQVKRLRQLFVEQEFRRRLKLAFDEKGIQIGIPQQSLLFPENQGQN